MSSGVWLVNSLFDFYYDDNDISNTTADYPTIVIRDGGDPTLCRNRISATDSQALWVHTNGKGTIEDNDLRSGGNETVHLAPTAACRLIGNHVFAPKGKKGVSISAEAQSTVKRNVTTHE